MSHKIRTFIAIDINSEIRNTIGKLQDRLKQCDCNIKWVELSNVHLTLKFLGDVKLKYIDAVNQALREWASECEPIETVLTQPGAFPSIDHPKIIWAGLKDEQSQIAELASTLENKLGDIGFKKEKKKFSPHITIGRVRSSKNLNNLTQAISEYTLPANRTQTIRRVILYKSTLTSTGPIYEILNKLLLANAQ